MRWGITAVVACAVVLPGPPAQSAPPALCKLVVDELGDTEAPYVESLDLTSADVASDATVVTAVIRVARLNSFELTAPGGVEYSLAFDVGRARLKFNAARTPDGELFEVFSETPLPGQASSAGWTVSRVAVVSGAFNEDLAEVRIHAPLSALRGHADLRPGTVLSRLRAVASWRAGIAGIPSESGRLSVAFTNGNDEATSTRVYPAGARSCVVPGR